MEYIDVNSKRWLSLENLPNERWKDIEGYEGFYQISDYGRVKSLKKPNRKNQFVEERIMVIHPNKNGYSILHFSMNGYHYRKSIHRLVALAFLDNPNNHPFVLHKKAVRDGGSNHYSNLYWGTQKDNMNDRKRENKYIVSTETIEKIIEQSSKPVNQYNLDGSFVRTWKSSVEASKVLNIDDSSIRKVCNGFKKSAGNYQWKTYNGEICNIEPYERTKGKYNFKCKQIVQLKKDGTFVRIWSSVKDIHETLHLRTESIYRVCRGERKTYNGYVWRYYEEDKNELVV